MRVLLTARRACLGGRLTARRRQPVAVARHKWLRGPEGVNCVVCDLGYAPRAPDGLSAPCWIRWWLLPLIPPREHPANPTPRRA